MLLSIQDVPLYERHLLFCSQLDHPRDTRRHGRRVRNVVVINRALIICPAQGAADNRVPLASGLNSKPVVRLQQPPGCSAAAPERVRESASPAALCFCR